MNLTQLLKGSADKLTQFKPVQIAALARCAGLLINSQHR